MIPTNTHYPGSWPLANLLGQAEKAGLPGIAAKTRKHADPHVFDLFSTGRTPIGRWFRGPNVRLPFLSTFRFQIRIDATSFSLRRAIHFFLSRVRLCCFSGASVVPTPSCKPLAPDVERSPGRA